MIDTFCTNHLFFAQLPIEAKVLFYIQSMSAWEYHCNWPHTAAGIYGYLERIWNTERLSPEDLRDWPRLSTLLVAKSMGHGEVETATRLPLLHAPDGGCLNSENAALH